MSEPEPRPLAGSSAPSLAFVRPLPRPQPASEAATEVATRIRAFSVPDRLFPAREFEVTHGSPPVKGIQLGHFLIEERIGRGGMGSVFRALDVRLERVVALKVLAPDFANDYEAAQRFRNEARAAARLDHDHIARVHYIGEDHGLQFIAFEYVYGTTVRQRIETDGALPEALAVSCALQIASALRHTAAHHVVHRDIKPSNLLLMADGRVKLVDLGLARDFNRETPSDLTVAGTALGTFDYISPEQALDARNVDVRSDIYSLGCTLFHMVIGSPPYPQGTMMQKVVLHHQQAPPDPQKLRPEISPAFAAVIRKMMSARPEDRFATPDELLVDLLAIAETMQLQPVAPDSVVWNAPESTRRQRWIARTRVWLIVLAVLAAVVILDRLRAVDVSPGAAEFPAVEIPLRPSGET